MSGRRPWRIEYRYSTYQTGLALKIPQDQPWRRHPSSFATGEAAAREASAGDFGYYLSFAAQHEYRVTNVDDEAAP